MTKEKLVEVGRVAFRVEGDRWVAYWADLQSMDGAVFIGSIRMGAVKRFAHHRDHFMALMRDVIADICEDEFGQRPVLDLVHPAPEHEKAGQS